MIPPDSTKPYSKPAPSLDDLRAITSAPITAEDRLVLEKAGWVFHSDDYIYIPNDEDGCMASGFPSIRRILLRKTRPDLFKKHGQLPSAMMNILTDIYYETP